jgi:endonuclease/exonuclease/phosphatase family metal-dependent hydrolase
MSLQVLSWNLFHGRALPPRNEDLLSAFAERIAAWEWDVALLQEVPPWWPAPLAAACGARERHALTSRNALLPVRRALARRWPELVKSNGGGCNAILVRGLGGIAAHARRRLCAWPERRVVHAVRVGDGRWFANVHASSNPPRARRDDAEAWAAVRRWAGDAPLVFGGDFNVVRLALPGLVQLGSSHVDHVFARGFGEAASVERLERGGLSDHAPLRVTLGGRG